MRRPLLPVLLFGLLACVPSCASVDEGSVNSVIGDIAEFLGASNPSRHVQTLLRQHDEATFRHVPDVPPTYETCIDEVRELAECDYDSWREVALATYVVSRVAVEDSAINNRAEAVGALVRMGGMVDDIETPPDGPAATDSEIIRAIGEVNKALARNEGRLEVGTADADRLLGVVQRIGDLRYETTTTWSPESLEFRLRDLRSIIKFLVRSGIRRETWGDPAVAVLDRSLINVAAQATRLSLARAVLHDPSPRVRAAAADAVGQLAPPTLAVPLRTAYGRERDDTVRREIVQGLGAMAKGGRPAVLDTVVPALIAALDDSSRNVAFNARDALRALAGEDLGEESGAWIRWWSARKAGR